MLLLKSFGRVRMIGRWCTARGRSHLRGRSPLHFHCARGFATQRLAHMLDSLVRVSRRVGENDFLRTLIVHVNTPQRGERLNTALHAVPHRPSHQIMKRPASWRTIRCLGHRHGCKARAQDFDASDKAAFPHPISHAHNRSGAARQYTRKRKSPTAKYYRAPFVSIASLSAISSTF